MEGAGSLGGCGLFGVEKTTMPIPESTKEHFQVNWLTSNLRWLLLVRRKIALQAAIERRLAALKTVRKENENRDDQPSDELELEEPFTILIP